MGACAKEEETRNDQWAPWLPLAGGLSRTHLGGPGGTFQAVLRPCWIIPLVIGHQGWIVQCYSALASPAVLGDHAKSGIEVGILSLQCSAWFSEYFCFATPLILALCSAVRLCQALSQVADLRDQPA